MNQELQRLTETVDLTFNVERLRLLQGVAVNQARELLGGQQDVMISRGDAFIAYIVTLFNRCYPYTFNQLMNVVHVSHYKLHILKTHNLTTLLSFQTRGRKSPPNANYQLHSISAAGNALFHSVSEPFPESHLFHLGAIALAVRNTIQKVDNYEFLKDCMSVCEQRYDEMSVKGHLPWMHPSERAIGANLLHKYVHDHPIPLAVYSSHNNPVTQSPLPSRPLRLRPQPHPILHLPRRRTPRPATGCCTGG